MPLRKDLLLIGKISGTHGIRGQLRVHPYAGDPAVLLGIERLLLETPEGEPEELRIAGSSVNGKRAIVTVEGCANINEVLHLVGRQVYLRRDQLPPLEEDEYYWDDLIGLLVETDEGESLGRLEEIIATGSNDVYVVRGPAGEVMVPATDEVVLKVDLEEGIMVISPLEGMIER